MKSADVVIVGAGAAGLATAIFTARAFQPGALSNDWGAMPGAMPIDLGAMPTALRRHGLRGKVGEVEHPTDARIVVLDGASKLGAKILIAGGGRCNVTNDVITPADYNGNPHIVRRVLSAFSAGDCCAWFREMGVPLHLEPQGKYFPDSNSGRDVLAALVREADKRDVRVVTGTRVSAVERSAEHGGFQVTAGDEPYLARRVVLATGGQSLPKSGSDGFGYALARGLGHSIVPTTPALAPMLLEAGPHAELAGVAHEGAITIRTASEKPVRITGSLLWTHFGLSGPAVLDASRHWLRAVLEQRSVEASLSFLPTLTMEMAENRWLQATADRPRGSVQSLLRGWIPARVAEALLKRLGCDAAAPLAQCRREVRQRVLRALLGYPLQFRGSRGYNYAEVTAGGVPLSEIDARTMESRVCPGLHLVGEILDVDGRIGGFNFQWAWSSAAVAGRALARSTCDEPAAKRSRQNRHLR